ncbi:MAG: hypothetical protein HZA61_15450 [Candidatus Eisenbacteria bacterium]|uniref:Uncharacterized protein n=1 Tax=Eiseniibacteriota bacterium TaxID=2212470 RepID=A0A933SEE7_UNCEI|nr:hypothetical protein [Candidatus Eisenbacteria bacterium]
MQGAPQQTDTRVRDLAGALAYHGHPDAPATLRVRDWSPPERSSRAVRALATCWGLAVLAVFLPVLHFVLVPSLLVAGPVVALSRLREHRTVRGASGTCPACGAAQAFAVSGALRDVTPVRCDACGRAISLRAPVTTAPD